MSQKNKIDFTTKPENDQEYTEDLMYTASVYQTSVIYDIHSFEGVEEKFDGFVLALVCFAYLRIAGTSNITKLDIPLDASISTLCCSEDSNLFVNIFNRYKTICETNKILSGAASILEPYYVEAANKASKELQNSIYKQICEFDWSNPFFTNQVCADFLDYQLIWDRLAELSHDKPFPDYFYDTYYASELLNPNKNQKILCNSILYSSFLMNLFNKSGWAADRINKNVSINMNNVVSVQINPVLWAIQSIEIFLFGCHEQLIGDSAKLIEIYKQNESYADVIFLPEVDNDSVPYVGPISIGNIIIDKTAKTYSQHYYIAFLYKLLNATGRMIVRIDEYYLTRSIDGLFEFLVTNNLIEAVIQHKNCAYILIDKNRPEARHGRILFSYGTHNISDLLKDYSCKSFQIKHDEGACIVSNNEIKLNDYNLLPKKFIYDFNRIKQQVGADMIQYVRHEANQLIRVFRFLVETPRVEETAVLMDLQQEVGNIPIPVGHT
ncbi:MAG TPA: hypothetical protein HPP76_03710, partial [Desulfuromonadales bacterium]|nr:hypothetical protein [Desulfuromonadales bacterium]